MNYQRKQLEELAKTLGFNRDPLEKMCRLIDVLSFINSHPLLKDILALKGGTAINLAIFDLPRLSLDIDLDFTLNVPRQEMEGIRRQVISLIEEFMAKNGYSPSKKSKRYYALDSLLFDYVNAGNNPDNLKIEINYVLRAHILEINQKKIQIDWAKQFDNVRIVNPIEIYAGKINALLTRSAPRDLFDFASLIKEDLFDEKEKSLLRKCALFYYALNLSQEGSFNPNNLNRISQHLAKTYLVPVMKKNTFFDVNKAKIEGIEYLNKLLKLTPKEKEFITLFAQKQYKPELLFDDPIILERIINHPMVMWKCSDHQSYIDQEE